VSRFILQEAGILLRVSDWWTMVESINKLTYGEELDSFIEEYLPDESKNVFYT